MLDLFVLFVFSVVFGRVLERFRVPWVFSALILGFLLTPFLPVSPTVETLGYMGMLFLLYLVGLELDIDLMLHQGRKITVATGVIILSEALAGSLVVHYFFGMPWKVSVLVALSFATVGEAVLVPILEDFDLLKKPLGTYLVGVGVLDDVLEVVSIVGVSLLLSYSSEPGNFTSLVLPFAYLSLPFAITFLFLRYKPIRFRSPDLEIVLPVSLALFFGLAYLGSLAHADALGALLAGIVTANMVEKRESLEPVKSMIHGLFAPVFFFWVGLTSDISIALGNLPLVAAVTLVASVSKILPSYLVARKELGREALLLGVGLCVRFSTSMAILKILDHAGIISDLLFSVLVGSTALFTLTVPVIFAFLLKRWGYD